MVKGSINSYMLDANAAIPIAGELKTDCNWGARTQAARRFSEEGKTRASESWGEQSAPGEAPGGSAGTIGSDQRSRYVIYNALLMGGRGGKGQIRTNVASRIQIYLQSPTQLIFLALFVQGTHGLGKPAAHRQELRHTH